MKNAKCSVCGDDKDKYVQRLRSHKNRLFCMKHKHQMIRHGRILKRTMRDKNEILIDGEVAHIILRNRKQNIVGKVFIDSYNVNKLKSIKWCLSMGYARTGPRKGSRLMHRYLFGEKGKELDHINGNKLDNREANIRKVCRSQNAVNRDKQANNTSGFRGIYFDKSRNKFAVELKYMGKKYYLGRFSTLAEAKKVRLEYEQKIFGNYRWGGQQ